MDDGGSATSASISPFGVALDGADNVYIADAGNCRVREVSDGIITTVAGDGACTYGGDGGPATSASVSLIRGVSLDSMGNPYIADIGNCRVRKVSAGLITTVAGDSTCGFSGDGGSATSASMSAPFGTVVDGAGNLYIADSNNCRVREVSGGTIATVAGDGTCGFGGDGGAATAAAVNSPAGVAVDGAGNLYIADDGNCRVREVSGGVITTVAGDGSCGYGGDGGAATSAALDPVFEAGAWAGGLAVDGAGNLYIADSNNISEHR